MEITFLGLFHKLTQHQMKTEGQGPDLIKNRSTKFPADLSVRGYLKEQKGDSYPAKAPRSSFDVLPVISPLI